MSVFCLPVCSNCKGFANEPQTMVQSRSCGRTSPKLGQAFLRIPPNRHRQILPLQRRRRSKSRRRCHRQDLQQRSRKLRPALLLPRVDFIDCFGLYHSSIFMPNPRVSAMVAFAELCVNKGVSDFDIDIYPQERRHRQEFLARLRQKSGGRNLQ